jgi:putative MFS transporter
MPTFLGNLAMCLLMGVAAGGMLPIVYALMAETLPPRQRGWIMVLQAGLATVIAYLITSGLASLLLPLFGWRIMWFSHLPFALLLLLFNRWIPESPRFLIEHGRAADAEQVMDRLGLIMVSEAADAPQRAAGHRSAPAAAVLFGPTYRSRTLVIAAYALSWGMIYWGFMTFLPALLKSTAIGGSQILFLSSVLAVPGAALVAYCYSAWSTRKTMALYGGITVIALLLIAITNLQAGTAGSIVLLVLLLTGTSGVVAVLSPYTAEVYPTSHRGAGSGLAAACTKAGGMFGPPLMALLLTLVPGARLIALVAAVPMCLATVAIARRGMETHGRDLEELQLEGFADQQLASARSPRATITAGD